MTEEVWKDIKDFPLYKISNQGRIESMKRGYPKILALTLNMKGYPIIGLFLNGKGYTRFIHRLVLEAFVGPRPEGHETNHKSGIKTDNSLLNLEWVMPYENIEHAFKTGLRSNKGMRHPRVKLKDEDVIEIRRLYSQGTNQYIIAKEFGIHQANVSSIICRRTWRHI